ncbi:MAG: hypothetical protein IPQ07_14665 [Myxococcales bacterium]|nr:hypothetical protein [Myxococcales bacterium]
MLEENDETRTYCVAKDVEVDGALYLCRADDGVPDGFSLLWTGTKAECEKYIRSAQPDWSGRPSSAAAIASLAITAAIVAQVSSFDSNRARR